MAKYQYNVIKGTSKSDWLTGSYFSDDIIYAANGNDYLFGYNGDDKLYGQNGNDRLYGGSGKDILDGGVGADYLNGGSGTDTATYETSSAGVQVSLYHNTATGGDAQGDSFYSIENLIGSNHADTLTGNNASNIISGLDGDDTLNGYGGNDTLIGGDGADAHNGGSGTDTVSYAGASSGVNVNLDQGTGSWGDAYGDTYINIENVTGTNYYDSITGTDGANVIDARGGNDNIADGGGDDTIYAGSGNDYFYAGSGADTYYGGTGTDSILFNESNAGVTVDLAAGTGLGGYAEGDTYSSIERAYGSMYDDTLIGNASDNVLNGGAGEDVIVGGLGDDWLSGDVGGCGSYGGGAAHADTFVFADNQGLEADIITDFAVGVDTIDFTQAVDFFGFNDLNNGGERYMEQVGGDTVIHYYDHTITLQNVNSDDLSADDFLFA